MKDTLHSLGASEIHAIYRIEGYHLSIIQPDGNVAIRRYLALIISLHFAIESFIGDKIIFYLTAK